MAACETTEAVAPDIPEGATLLSGGRNWREFDAPGRAVNRVLTVCGVEELAVGGKQLTRLKLLSCLLGGGGLLAD